VIGAFGAVSPYILSPLPKKTVQNCFREIFVELISTNVDNFWHKDGEEDKIMYKLHSFSTLPDSCQRTTVLTQMFQSVTRCIRWSKIDSYW